MTEALSPTERNAELIRSLNGMGSSEIRTWFRTRLRGLDGVGSSAGESPHDLVAHIYHSLDRAARQDIEHEFYALLEDLATDGAAWTSGAAVELLLLADPLLLQLGDARTNRRELEAEDALIRIADSRNDDGDDPDRSAIRVAAVQAMVTVGVKVPPRFWYDLYDRHGARYAAFVIEALARTDVETLSTWLTERLPDAALEASLLNLLPFILDTNGSRACGALLSSLYERASHETRDEFEAFASDVGISFAPRAAQLELAYALNHALAFVKATLRLTANGGVPHELRELLVDALNHTRDSLKHHNGLSQEVAQLLWAKYVDCLDAALNDSELIGGIFQDLANSVDSIVLERLGAHLVLGRGADAARIPLRYVPDVLPITPRQKHVLVNSFDANLRASLVAELQSSEFRSVKRELIDADRPAALFEELIASL